MQTATNRYARLPAIKRLTDWAGAAWLAVALMVGLAGSAHAQKPRGEADTASPAL